MDGCVFCAIAAGRSEASIVFCDDRVIAFLDHNPVTPGHLMVIPVGHLPLLADLDEETAGHIFVVGRRLAAALRASGLPCNGVNLFLADGEAAFQDVPHTHLHVIPRTTGDGFTIDASAWGEPKPSRATLDGNAAAIRAALAGQAQSGL